MPANPSLKMAVPAFPYDVSAPMSSYRGFYINLARNLERREFLSAHLAQRTLSDRYERVEAVDGRAAKTDHPTPLDEGNLGLWLTHEGIYRRCRSGEPHLRILEDDAYLPRDFPHHAEALLADSSANWDVLYTDVTFPPETRAYLAMLQAMEQHRRTGVVQVVPAATLEMGASGPPRS
jgi:hypothetical protein